MNNESNTHIIPQSSLICPHCGHTGSDVISRTFYHCGNYVTAPECEDRVACWRRFDSIFTAQADAMDWAINKIKGGI